MKDQITKDVVKLLVIASLSLATLLAGGLTGLFAISLLGCGDNTPDIVMGPEPEIIVLAFVAPWCKSCQEIEPILDEIHLNYSPRVRIITVNIDKRLDLAESYEITSIPTFRVEVYNKVEGVLSIKVTRTQDISVVVRIVKENMK